MKTSITVSAVALAVSGGLATAAPFDSYEAYSSVDLDPGFEISNYTRPADWMSRDVQVSLEVVNRGNPEIDSGPGDYKPVEIVSDDLPTSLEVLTRGNPDYPRTDV